MSDLTERIAQDVSRVRQSIAEAAVRSGRRTEDVTLIAVSKYVGTEETRALIAAGCQDLGESRPQDLWRKAEQLQDQDVRWHMIGTIQSRKTKQVVGPFVLVHSVDRVKIANRLSRDAQAADHVMSVLLEVNVSGEASKSGCTPADLPALANAISALPRLTLRGLMAIPEPTDDRAAQDAAFATVRDLQASLNLPLDTLSMGMSHDLESAIAQGATWVRIGTALFGARDYGQP